MYYKVNLAAQLYTDGECRHISFQVLYLLIILLVTSVSCSGRQHQTNWSN